MIIFKKGLSLCVVLLFLFTSSFASAFDSSKTILGEIINNGIVEIETRPDQWMPLKGKLLPVFDGAHFRSADGRMSLILKDGSRVEVGGDTDITIAGNDRNIVIFLKKGSIGCSIPDNSHLAVTTPSWRVQIAPSETLQQVSYPVIDKGATKALINVDDKRARIAVVEGSLLVLNNGTVTARRLSAGEVVDVSSNKGQEFTQIAALDQSATANSSVSEGLSQPIDWSKWMWAVPLVLIPASIAIATSNKSSVSPSSP